MDDLAKRAYAGLARFQLTLAVVIFASAWSLAYWRGWLVWSLFLVCCVAITRYFLKHDRALIVRRIEAGPAAEREPRQKLILTLAYHPGVLVVGPRAGRAARSDNRVAPHRRGELSRAQSFRLR